MRARVGAATLNATWVAHIPAIATLVDAGALSVGAPYGAVAFDCPGTTASLDATIRSAREVTVTSDVPVWPVINDDFFDVFGVSGRQQVVEYLASQVVPPTLVLQTRLVGQTLSTHIAAWRNAFAAAAATATTLRVLVTREHYLGCPVEAERIEWFDLAAARAATAFGRVDTPFSGALKWVIEQLEMRRQSPAESHLSVYLDPQAEADMRGALFRYWVREAEIIATNNPGPIDRLIFVRGATHLLASHRDCLRAKAAPAPSQSTTLAAPLKAKIAVVVHLHYSELWPDFEAALASIAEPFDLYVSTAIGMDQSVAAMIRTTHPDANVIAVENRGRDVWPFFAVHARFNLLRYELICKVHSKRSKHIAAGTSLPIAVVDGNDWRQQLLMGLLGSTQMVDKILRAFEDPAVGMICPAEFIKPIATGTVGSRRRLGHLLQKLELQVPESAQFAAGTMFWARTAAIAPLLRASFRNMDFEAERGQVDFTLHHAIERIFGSVVSSLGFRLVSLD